MGRSEPCSYLFDVCTAVSNHPVFLIYMPNTAVKFSGYSPARTLTNTREIEVGVPPFVVASIKYKTSWFAINVARSAVGIVAARVPNPKSTWHGRERPAQVDKTLPIPEAKFHVKL